MGTGVSRSAFAPRKSRSSDPRVVLARGGDAAGRPRVGVWLGGRGFASPLRGSGFGVGWGSKRRVAAVVGPVRAGRSGSWGRRGASPSRWCLAGRARLCLAPTGFGVRGRVGLEAAVWRPWLARFARVALVRRGDAERRPRVGVWLGGRGFASPLRGSGFGVGWGLFAWAIPARRGDAERRPALVFGWAGEALPRPYGFGGG